jgi:hypothetical protein
MSDDQIYAKCARRLIPFMMLLYIVNFVDRVNVGFAALTMNRDLMLQRERVWIRCGCVLLGLFAVSDSGETSSSRSSARGRGSSVSFSPGGAISASTRGVYAEFVLRVRILLGIAEAGFFPA